MIIGKCYIATKNKEMDVVNEELCTNSTALRHLGRRILYDPDKGGYYKTKRYDLQVPYRAGIIPGKLIQITCDKLGLTNEKMIVRSTKLNGTTNSIFTNMTAESYDVGA